MSSSGMDEQWGFGGVSPETKKEPESILLLKPPSKCLGTLREHKMGGY